MYTLVELCGNHIHTVYGFHSSLMLNYCAVTEVSKDLIPFEGKQHEYRLVWWVWKRFDESLS